MVNVPLRVPEEEHAFRCISAAQTEEAASTVAIELGEFTLQDLRNGPLNR
jgi:hypothetical protein